VIVHRFEPIHWRNDDRRIVMPTTFYDREQGFEAKFAHDEAISFLVMARRDKLFARWAAATLGLSDEEGKALLKRVLAVPNGPQHDQAILPCITDLLLLQGREGWSEASLSSTLDRCMAQARTQLLERPAGLADLI
jgi:hypothetical protein